MNRTKIFDSTKMTKEVALLFETALVAGASARKIAERIGVSFPTVYGWYEGRKPLDRHLRGILEETRRLEAFARKYEVDLGEGLVGWKARVDPEDDPAYEAEMKTSAELHALFARTVKEIKTSSDWHVLKEAWPQFAEVVKFLRRNGLKFRI